MPNQDEDVDVVVLGMGVGGEEVAGRLAEAGLAVVGIEHRLVGGECPYWGCIPSKMMIRAANLLAETRRVDGMAGQAGSTRTGHRSPGASGKRRPTTGTTRSRWTGSPARAGDSSGARPADGPGGVAVGDVSSAARRGIVIATGTGPSCRRSRDWPTRRTGPTARRSRPRPARFAGRPRWRCDRAGAGPGVRPVRGAGLGGGGAGPADRPGGARVAAPSRPRRLGATASVHTGVGPSGSRTRAGPVRWPAARLRAELLVASAAGHSSGRWAWTRGAGPEARSWRWTSGCVPVTGCGRSATSPAGTFTHVAMYQAGIAVRDILGSGRAAGGLPRAAPGDVHRSRDRRGRPDRAAGPERGGVRIGRRRCRPRPAAGSTRRATPASSSWSRMPSGACSSGPPRPARSAARCSPR